MKKIFLVFFSILLLTGCATAPEANSEFSAADITFAEEMIPHHEQAMLMSDLAFTNSTNEDVLALAREINAAQAPEVEKMGSWQGVSASTHMGHTMAGMLSDQEIQSLRDAKGPTFDRLFLEGMIAHHQGAIGMAQKVVNSKNREVAALAEAIIDAQEKEIAYMKELIKSY